MICEKTKKVKDETKKQAFFSANMNNIEEGVIYRTTRCLTAGSCRKTQPISFCEKKGKTT